MDAYNGEGEVPEGLPTFADGLRAALICDAMLRSAAEPAMGERRLSPSGDVVTLRSPPVRPPAGLAELGGKGPRSPG